jgi:heterodisulfide reductase subunit C
MISSLIFICLLALGSFLFARKIKSIRRNILLGKDVDRSDNSSARWKTMTRVAMGQSKMGARPVAAILHGFIYIGFILINIEVLEIVIDGIFGTHRILAFTGSFYNFLIGFFEVLAFLVLVSCVVFLIRRNVMHIRRFRMSEMTGWPKSDAKIILIVEITLMFALLSMNAADALLQELGNAQYAKAGSFPISQFLQPLYSGLSESGLVALERGMWWFHIAGILAFLVYVPYSKHFHIFLAFPNTYYSNLLPKGRFNNLATVTAEVKLMMDPEADPYATPAEPTEPQRFGAKDATDLTWKQLMESYTCTECGRCSSVCPANMTGKKLSPRKIMMDTRDRIEEIGKNLDQNTANESKSLLGDYITEEEIWACTSCNACVDACPVNIDPLSIIVDLRRYLIMEESKSPESITSMFNNIENNGAPWAFPAADRGNWRDELQS